MFEKKENVPVISLKEFAEIAEITPVEAATSRLRTMIEEASIVLVNSLDIALLPYAETVQVQYLKLSSRYIRDLSALGILEDTLFTARNIRELLKRAPKDMFLYNPTKIQLENLINLVETAMEDPEEGD